MRDYKYEFVEEIDCDRIISVKINDLNDYMYDLFIAYGDNQRIVKTFGCVRMIDHIGNESEITCKYNNTIKVKGNIYNIIYNIIWDYYLSISRDEKLKELGL